jgi:hypothetical protein
MGASVFVYWPGITESQMEDQPDFANDCKAWGDWMAVREEHPEVLAAMDRFRVGALRTLRTDGVEDSEVDWVTPKDLSRAALRLRELVLAGNPDTKRIVETYAIGANAVDPVAEEFAQDLSDIADMAEWAKRQGATRMTLDVNW